MSVTWDKYRQRSFLNFDSTDYLRVISTKCSIFSDFFQMIWCLWCKIATLSCLLYAIQIPLTSKTSLLQQQQNKLFNTLPTFIWDIKEGWMKNSRMKLRHVFAQRSFFVQRERVKLLSRPKKCYFHSPLELFWLTMTSQIESTRLS